MRIPEAGAVRWCHSEVAEAGCWEEEGEDLWLQGEVWGPLAGHQEAADLAGWWAASEAAHPEALPVACVRLSPEVVEEAFLDGCDDTR